MRGYFEIGIWHGKTEANIGTLWRSAYQLGATGVFTIGARFRQSAADTTKTYRHIPLRQYTTMEQFKENIPYDCPVVAVETGGKDIRDFLHFERCVYLLGAEDNGLSEEVLAQCHYKISLPAIRSESYNVAVAGSIVMYDRLLKTYKVKD